MVANASLVISFLDQRSEAVAQLLWTEVFNESSNNSGLFCHKENAFIISEIPMVLVDIHDLDLVSLCFRKDTRIFEYCRTGIFRKRVFLGILGIFLKIPKITIFRIFSKKFQPYGFFTAQLRSRHNCARTNY